MFIAVINDRVVRSCRNIDEINDMVAHVLRNHPVNANVIPYPVEVYTRIGSYTTKVVESYPKEKPWYEG